jgi:RNA polymerase sigma factor (sigma-70 family)
MRMSEISDTSLLHDYVTRRDEDAFAELVRRHLPMVYSAAFRKLGHDPSAAEDVAQSVFLQLALRGGDLSRHPVLAGWLYVTASRKAADHSRHLRRRQQRETMLAEAHMPESSEAAWREIKPLLDDAMLDLADDDRHALIVRYFEGNDFAAVGRILKVSPDAARMRVNRGLERLRNLLKKRGITASAGALEASLLQETVEAFPSGLASSIARAVRTLPAPEVSASLATGVAKVLSSVAILLLVTAAGTAVVRSWRSTMSARQTEPSASERSRSSSASVDSVRFLRGRARMRPQGAPVDPKVAQALGYLRSALFDTALGRAERQRLLEQSAQMLVGFEGESIPLFREALSSADPEVLALAVEGLGWFGPLPREFGPELLALLENPQLTEQTGLIANRLLPAMLNADSPVATLLSLLERRLDLNGPIQYLLTAVIGSNQSQLAANRELVEALLNDPKPELQEAAKAILAELPEPPPQPTPEVSSRLTAGLTSGDATERQKALLQTVRLQAATPEIIQALAAMHRQDPSLAARVDAGIELERLAPNDPALALLPASERESTTRELLSRFDRQEASVTDLLTALADRSADPGPILQRLPGMEPTYWGTHPDDKMLTIQVLASLHRERDAHIYETVTDTYAQLNHVPRTTYSLDQLGPYFTAMATALTPGEYAIAMRDLKPSLDSYWRAHGFNQPEPTHLPTSLVQILLVGPFHQNRPAYDQMLRAMREIDPAFEPPQP